MDTAPALSIWILIGTFAWAATAKFARFDRWADAVRRYGVAARAVRAAAVAIPLLELAVVAAFLAGASRVAAAATMALLGGFTLSILAARTRAGDRVPCGCFGGTRERDYRALLVRNGFLGALAAVVLVSGRDVPIAPTMPATEDLLPAVLVGFGIVLALWTARQVAGAFKRGPR